ncbi:AraC family transcriptional regulator [Labrenzia sp. 011]|uniref:helix-turn-helix domain-containing protein n=1 Tax=Labrenzia sp. 011 TaxID=2171494 RepID=UPI001056EFB6|nr:AraC family transcriptional regulator [Labrenzia sp. 011]
MENRLALVRATHLNSYISVLRDIGAPVDRELDRSKLPSYIEETPDLYVSVPIAMDWVARTGRDLDLMELGLLGAQAASLSTLRPPQQAAVMAAQTGLTRLRALADVSRFEDSVLEMRVRREAGNVRVICTMAGLDHHPLLCLAEWLNLQAIISVVRSVAGPSWQPSEMCFFSSNCPPAAVHAALPDTRILVGQPQTSVVVESAYLALSTSRSTPCRATTETSEDKQLGRSESWEFVKLLRKMLQPYLSEGRADIAFTAEMAGMSTRSLQRRLKLCGSSYSQILQEACFELACIRLGDPGLKIIDVAMSVGYESPQHFTRAFRRFTGMTPTDYRGQTTALDRSGL